MTDRRSFMTTFGLTTFGIAAGAALGAGPALAEAQKRDTPGVEFAFELNVLLKSAMDIGATSMGERRRIPIIGGGFSGERIKGKVLPGGADWQLIRIDGVTQVQADYMIQTDDGAYIHVNNSGIIVPGKDGKPPYIRTNPRFEAPIGKHDWLNKNMFLGTIGPAAPGTTGVTIGVFRVT